MHGTAVGGASDRAPVSGSDTGSFRYLAGICLVAALGGLLFGFETAVVNGTIERLQQQFGFSDLTKGWVVGTALIGCLFGSAIAGALSDRFGRKWILVLSAFLFTVSALGCTFPQGPSTVAYLIVARFIGGTGIGIASMLSPLYIAEVSPARLRGGLIAMYQFAIAFGVLCAYISNYSLWRLSQYLHGSDMHGLLRWIVVDDVWRVMFLVGALPGALFFAFALLVPESPRWLTKQGFSDQARKILTRISGRSAAAAAMTEIEETLALESGSFRQLFHAALRVPLLIGIILPFFSQISGINVIIYYGESVFKYAGLGEDPRLLSQVVFGTVTVLSTVVAMLVVDKLGRKPLLLVGIAGVGLTLFLGGWLFSSIGPIWLLVIFALFLACFNISYGPICWIIISEVFPTKVRGRAMSISTFSLWAGCTLVTITFPKLLDGLGPTHTFWLYAVTTPIAFLFVWFLVPETKGRTLEEIERQFT